MPQLCGGRNNNGQISPLARFWFTALLSVKKVTGDTWLVSDVFSLHHNPRQPTTTFQAPPIDRMAFGSEKCACECFQPYPY
jgi:hypothetical protein